jgi:dTDP-4-dehydrorhamnose 3,5-epimerase
MKVTKLEIEGLLLIELPVFRDDRGFFLERFNEEKFKANGVPVNFVQDNQSRSAPGVLRGLHFQNDPPQGKLVGVTRGRIWDVAVDIRKNSPTFGRHVGVELSEDNAKILWVPYGFAHGFCVLGDSPADVVYKVTGLYNPKSESGVLWNDPDLAVKWPIAKPILSPRDEKLFSFKELRAKL